MDYNFYLTIFATNFLTIFTYTYYIERQNSKLQRDIQNCKIIDEVLNERINNLQNDLEKLEKFKIKVLEKNIVIKENRAWDIINSSDEEEDEEIDD